jgi:DNA-directed RNA polymerase I subunit RPA43
MEHLTFPPEGKIKLCSPDHVALLVHRTFNVSIPRHHLPKDEWQFEHGPAENDPEFGPAAVGADENEEKGEEVVEAVGRYVSTFTGEILGDQAGVVEFTVIG